MIARGWCRAHYRRWQRWGDPQYRPTRVPAEQRFWPRVNKNGPLPSRCPELGVCWEWTGGTSYGYGAFFIGGGRRNIPAHRFSYELEYGPVPAGSQLDHLCRNHPCVKPRHLEAVTSKENTRRGIGHGSEKHCPQGHPYSQRNTYRNPTTRKRHCRTCHRADSARRRAVARAHRAGL